MIIAGREISITSRISTDDSWCLSLKREVVLCGGRSTGGSRIHRLVISPGSISRANSR
ncbi:hypothetical protein D1872_330960 [compost metagenome]